MAFDRQKLLPAAGLAARESRTLEFKREFNTAAPAAWCEVIKDIVALANTEGGVIVFGLENDGAPSGVNCTGFLAYDLSDITNKIFKYTGYQFADIEIIAVERPGGIHCAALLIAPADVPIVFTKPGTYDIGDGKQKTAFSQGSVYFRHGAKSEPGNRDDLLRWRDRLLAQDRKTLMQGMRKVVRAPAGHTVAVVPLGRSSPDGTAQISARITADPGAPKVSIHNTDELWPHRQKELIKRVVAGLPAGVSVNGHDLLCINKKIDALKSRPDFAHKPHKLASAQYSDAYADWIIAQATADPKYFEDCRTEYRLHQTTANAPQP